MGNHKQKRKKQQEQRRAEQIAARRTMTADASIQHATSPNLSDASRWKRFKEWVERESSFTDWCITAFTLALAITGIYQYNVINRQLDAMRKDQRAWVEFQVFPDAI
jgi:hypothetical protein